MTPKELAATLNGREYSCEITRAEEAQARKHGLVVVYGASDDYPVEARLKYRDNSGRVSFWYELIRPDRAFKTAVQSAMDQIKDATGFLLIHGTP